MTARDLFPSSHLPLRAAAREWVIACNPHAHKWFAYPIVNVFSPFGMGLMQTWAIRDGFSSKKGQLQFLGEKIPSNADMPLNHSTARLTAEQVLTAIDRFDDNAYRRHRWGTFYLLFMLGLIFSLCILPLQIFAPTSPRENLCLSFLLGYGLTQVLYLLDRTTCVFRKEINVPKEKIRQLQHEILSLRTKQDWGLNVQRIFQEIQMEISPISLAEASSELKKRYEEVLERCAEMSDELAQTKEKLAEAEAQLQIENSAVKDLLQELVLRTDNGDTKIPVNFLVNTVMQSGEPGYNASVAMPILLLTAWSLRQNPPGAEEKLQATIYKRIEKSAEIVRSHCRNMPLHRNELGASGYWDEYVEHIKLPIYKILVPKEGKKTAYGTSNFRNKFPYLAQVQPA